MSDNSVIEDLQRRLAALEDKAALAELVSRYGRTVDARDWDGWGRTLTDDVVLDAPIGQVTGRKGVVEGAAQMQSTTVASQHLIANLDFAVDGDTATGTAVLLFHGIPNLEMPVNHMALIGPYEFYFRRTWEGWQISKMVLKAYAVNETEA